MLIIHITFFCVSHHRTTTHKHCRNIMAVLTVALKTLLSLLTCVMAVALVYGFVTDHFVSCFDLKAWWMQVEAISFCINISLITAWFFYKESRWILRVVFIIIIFWGASCTICGYILLQLFKLSPEESSKDPIYFVLVRRQKRDAVGCTGRLSVVSTRIIFVSLVCLMLGILVFAFVIDGSPFRAEVLSPCMKVILIDLSIQVVVFSLWIAYKESSWINALLWIIFIICFGSIALYAYIARELFYLSPEQPVFLVLFNKKPITTTESPPKTIGASPFYFTKSQPDLVYFSTLS
ncbi:hypothetical protein M8C21_032706 [Ambrosia artemisiifolia]|uniref:Uncharacterized protein n=1 Tax=Ambrosia artemisiifolia TaxID=4212 RepID=A0AAD5D945_AMBAR|nr:hypothetical protein M8C21_032706 [Ambrosia artemisiifolia]